jgi:hypothetical protein
MATRLLRVRVAFETNEFDFGRGTIVVDASRLAATIQDAEWE